MRSFLEMKKTVISVIIPIYNVERYLSECLDSVLAQTLENIEIVCINDASPDDSIGILNRYAANDARIRIAQQSTNQGLAAARNTGIALARGEYIFFLDSDDILFSVDSLSKMYEIAKRDAADEVIGATLRWNEETEERVLGYHTSYLKTPLRGVLFEDTTFLSGNVIACNKLLKSSFLKENNILFNTNLKKFEDNPFSCRVHLLARSISTCTQATYLHRLRKESGSQSLMQINTLDYLYHTKSANDILDFLEQTQQPTSIRHIFERRFLSWLQLDVVGYSGESLELEKKNEILECYREVLTRISESTTPLLTPIELSFLHSIKAKEYEKLWNSIITPSHQDTTSPNSIALQKKLDRVYESTSWRISAPIRLAAKILKKHN